MSIVERLEERSLNADRSVDKGFINPGTNSSIMISENGNVTVASSKNVQYKLNYATGQAREVSYESQTVTNRKNIKTDEIVLNKHKFNNQFYELTDYKQIGNDPTSAIGNLTINTTVLVKAWEPYLEKWVLIRRPARMPLFYNMLPIPDVPAGMNLVNKDGTSATDVSNEIKEMRDYDKQQESFR